MMSDYFDRLVAKSIHNGDILRPHIPSIYEMAEPIHKAGWLIDEPGRLQREDARVETKLKRPSMQIWQKEIIQNNIPEKTSQIDKKVQPESSLSEASPYLRSATPAIGEMNSQIGLKDAESLSGLRQPALLSSASEDMLEQQANAQSSREDANGQKKSGPKDVQSEQIIPQEDDLHYGQNTADQEVEAVQTGPELRGFEPVSPHSNGRLEKQSNAQSSSDEENGYKIPAQRDAHMGQIIPQKDDLHYGQNTADQEVEAVQTGPGLRRFEPVSPHSEGRLKKQADAKSSGNEANGRRRPGPRDIQTVDSKHDHLPDGPSHAAQDVQADKTGDEPIPTGFSGKSTVPVPHLHTPDSENKATPMKKMPPKVRIHGDSIMAVDPALEHPLENRDDHNANPAPLGQRSAQDIKPIVRVTIGRLEVRAVMQSAPPRQVQTQKEKSSLDDYLNKPKRGYT